MDFPHAGDLWLISTVYPDGTVAALEELIGNHGGLGGEQTDAFIFHPARHGGARDAQLDRRLPHSQQPPRRAGGREAAQCAAADRVADWAPKNLLKGLGQVGTWVGNALGCIMLNREAYEKWSRIPT